MATIIVNFEIEDNHALRYNGRHIDLHNNFNFTGFVYKTADRQLTLSWTISKGEWVRENEFSQLTLIHSDVFFLSLSYDNKEYPYPEDDKRLDMISFFPSADRQTNDSATLQDKPVEGDDLIYIFETGYYIRVGCGKAELTVD